MEGAGTAGGDTFRQDMEDDLVSVAKIYGRTSMPGRNERSSFDCGPAVSPLHNTEPTIRHPSSPTTVTAPPSPLPWDSFKKSSSSTSKPTNPEDDSIAIVTDDAFNITPITPSPIHRHSPLNEAFRELRTTSAPTPTIKTPKPLNRRLSMIPSYRESPKPSPLKPFIFQHCPAKDDHKNDNSKCASCGLTYKEYRMKAIEESKKHYAYRSRNQARSRNEMKEHLSSCSSDLRKCIANANLDNRFLDFEEAPPAELKTPKTTRVSRQPSIVESVTPKKPRSSRNSRKI
uniref:DBF4-type domain-containing protein n=1 Tax=Panagrellus redivivus TaxID=6233 RepID=A0A7E4W8G3_PANRE